MTGSLESSIVRIWAPNGDVIGAGFLVSAKQILTCAHVVAASLGLPDDAPERPEALVHLDFPRVAPGYLHTAHVILWRALQANGGGDIAGLELETDPPIGVQAARLAQIDDLWEHPFRAFGFPRGQEAGVWSTGRLLGRQAINWVQIEDVKEPGFSIERGFSGSPVWDTQLEAVVGIVVATENRANLKTAFAIPIDVLAKTWPIIESLIQPFVFLCYSRADSQIVARLLNDLYTQGISTWIDREGLKPGTLDWEESLRTAIRAAQAVLLIASPNARSSRYVKDELRLAEMYQRPLYPVWIAGSEWMDVVPLGWGGVQYIDARDKGFEAAVYKIVTAINQASFTPSKVPAPEFEPRNPYKGLRAFTQKDTRDFFGRDKLIEELIETLEKTLETEKKSNQSARLLAIIGPSGSGKSSMVMAGLLPQLQQGKFPTSKEWIYLERLVPGQHPIEALALTLSSNFSSRSLKAICEDLQDDGARGFHLLAASLTRGSVTKVVLFVDQFEELFTQTISENERRQFIDLLITAATEPSGPIILILTLRADFYDRPLHYLELGQLIETHQKSILPMMMKDFRAVIEMPAALPDVQLNFEGDLVGDLLYEVQGQVGALPLLQFTLDELFQRRSGQQLTLLSYHEIGGVKGALAKQAESAYASLPSEEHCKMARALFLRLIDPGTTEQEITRRRAALSEIRLPDPHEALIIGEVAKTFIEARLLTTNTVAGVSTLEVSHEALIRQWIQLADWLGTARSDVLLQQTISEGAAEWLRHGRPGERVYRGEQLVEAQAWASRNVSSLDEMNFLQAGVAEREREEAARLAQKAREQELYQRAAKRQRYVLGMMGVTSSVLVIALIVTLWLQAQVQARDNDLQRSLPVRVTNLNDHGPGSLREAIALASSGSAITFARNLEGTITLASGELQITKNLSISGPGQSLLSISGANKSRVFSVNNGVVASISNLTIKDGYAKDYGGGIFNYGTLMLINSTISHSSANEGGGIFNSNALILTNSTVSGNTAFGDTMYGGGGISSTGGSLILTNSTVSGNKAISNGGGISIPGSPLLVILTNTTISSNAANEGGGISITGGYFIFITSSTIFDNTATHEGGGIAIGIVPGTNSYYQLQTSIVAGNSAGLGPDIWGKLTSIYYDLIQDVSGTIINSDNSTAKTIIIGSSPNLGPLQNNGGLTLTHALLLNSPAIDWIPDDICRLHDVSTDQRGVQRPQGKGCDVGAYEYEH